MSDPFQGPAAPDHGEVEGSSGGLNTRVLAIGGGAGVVLLAAAGYFLFFSGGGGANTDLGPVPSGVVASSPSSSPSTSSTKPSTRPANYHDVVGHDPFKALPIEATPTVAPTSASTSTSTPVPTDTSVPVPTATTSSVPLPTATATPTPTSTSTTYVLSVTGIPDGSHAKVAWGKKGATSSYTLKAWSGSVANAPSSAKVSGGGVTCVLTWVSKPSTTFVCGDSTFPLNIGDSKTFKVG